MMSTSYRFQPGYRFQPTDLELVESYLRKKINNEKLPCDIISELNVYAKNPDEIAAEQNFKPRSSNDRMYFFSPREKKYPRGTKPSRTAGYGYWKASSTKPIYDNRNVRVGSQRGLVYMKGAPGKGKKSKWIMQEYTIEHSSLQIKTNDDKWDAIVLCAIYESPRQPKDTQDSDQDTIIYESPRQSKDTQDSDQDTAASQLNGRKRNSSEPSLNESPNSHERNSKMRRVSSDQSLPCYPHEPQGNLASSSTAQVVQAASSAGPDHGISFASEDHGLQQFQSSLRHQETQTSSSQQQESCSSSCTGPEANICDLSDMDELLAGWDEFQKWEELQSSLSHQGIQMLTSDQQQQFNPITSIDVGDADIFNMDELLAGWDEFQSSLPHQGIQMLTSDQQQHIKPIISIDVGDNDIFSVDELDILLSSPTISPASNCM